MENPAIRHRVQRGTAVYDVPTHLIELTGMRPRLSQGQDYVEADRITVDHITQELKFYDDCVLKVWNFSKDKTPADGDAKPAVITANYGEVRNRENLGLLRGSVLVDSPADQVKISADEMQFFLSEAVRGGCGQAADTATRVRRAVPELAPRRHFGKDHRERIS